MTYIHQKEHKLIISVYLRHEAIKSLNYPATGNIWWDKFP